MQQEQKRTSRPRKTQNFINSDDEDQQAYVKKPKKDNRQKALSISIMAKLLIQFINKTNFEYKEHQRELKKWKKDKEKKIATQITQISLKFDNQPINNNKRLILPLKKDKIRRKQKNLYNSLKDLSDKKQQHLYNQTVPLSYQVSVDIINYNCLNYLKGMPFFAKNHDLQENCTAKSQHLLLYGSPIMNSIQQQKCENQGALLKQSELKDRQKIIIKKFESKQVNRQKLFTRSSFHVAIAYHIYFQKNNISLKNLSFIQDFDPTRHAKRLKQQKNTITQCRQTF